MASLLELANRYKTDKSKHYYAGVSYIDVYEKQFSSIRDKALNVLEIGVRSGASMKMWRDYFKNSNIYGIDIMPQCKKHVSERINIFIGDQSDECFLNKVVDEVGKIDIIIDDGSHVNNLTLASFNILFPQLNNQGIYVIEDLRTSYQALDDKINVRKNWPGMSCISKDVDLNNDRRVMNNFFTDKLKDMDFASGDILSMQFWSMICVIHKV